MGSAVMKENINSDDSVSKYLANPHPSKCVWIFSVESPGKTVDLQRIEVAKGAFVAMSGNFRSK